MTRGAPSAHGHLPAANWSDARRLLHSLAAPEPETVPLTAAIGRVTTSPVAALRPLPHYESSAMDGWVYSGDEPWRLGAGADSHRAGPALMPGTAVPILTGGALPEGATGVLRSEHGTVDGGRLRRRPESERTERRRRDIRPAAEEAAAGDVLVPAGRRLSPFDVALLEVAGFDEVEVARAPRAAVLVTGDEVIGAGLPEPGQVRDAFSTPLAAVLSGWGADAVAAARIHDDASSIADALLRADAQLVITTGGTAHSSADHLRAATAAAGYEPVIDGVDVRPGRHTFIARRPGTADWVACLPGNPLAAFCAMVVVVEPLVAGLLGRPYAEPRRGALFTESSADVARITPVVLDGTNARAVPYRNAHMLRGLAGADALAVQPAGTGPGPIAAPLFELPLPR
jgi:molybdopterin molybdotransferase